MTLPIEREIIARIQSGSLPGHSCTACGAPEARPCVFHVAVWQSNSDDATNGQQSGTAPGLAGSNSSQQIPANLELPALLCEKCDRQLLHQPTNRLAYAIAALMLLVACAFGFFKLWIPAGITAVTAVIPIAVKRRMVSARQNLYRIILSEEEIYAELLEHHPDCSISLNRDSRGSDVSA